MGRGWGLRKRVRGLEVSVYTGLGVCTGCSSQGELGPSWKWNEKDQWCVRKGLKKIKAALVSGRPAGIKAWEASSYLVAFKFKGSEESLMDIKNLSLVVWLLQRQCGWRF